jgi:hypothetical protein
MQALVHNDENGLAAVARSLRRGVLTLAAMGVALVPHAASQTTQGIIVGAVTNTASGIAVSTASIRCLRPDTGTEQSVMTDSHGAYAIAGLSPARYIVTVSAPGYQSQQARAIDLPVSGRIDLNVHLRPLYDLWEAGRFHSWVMPESQQSLQFYGPDVDTSRVVPFSSNTGSVAPLENSRSDVIAQEDIQSLPLTGRDVYTMLLLLPGVTADTATARGLGFSVNGQRASSSNFLLDGVENNNQLVTGPLTSAVPEFLQEYRVSTSNYSAEYGRTSGFVANAVTRTGSNSWHADLFVHWKGQWLAANGFQENAAGIARSPLKEWEPGITASGPVLRRRVFWSGGFETRRFRSLGDPQAFALPTRTFVDSLNPSSFAGKYLRRYVPESQPTGPGDVGFVALAPPVDLNRWGGVLRLDDSFRNDTEHLFARVWLDQLSLPGLFFNPYPQFSSSLRQKSASVAVGLSSQVTPSLLNELRASRTGDSERLDTFQPAGVPNLSIFTVQAGEQSYNITLPTGSSADGYVNKGANWEVLDNATWARGRHVAKAGFGWFERGTQLELAQFPLLEYASLDGFASNQPQQLVAETDRLSAALAPVSPGRSYRYRQFYGFVQDSFHVTARLMFDYGLRYESYGVPHNVGAVKDVLIQLASGSNIQSALQGATSSLGAARDQPLFHGGGSKWAPRAGLAWDPTGRGSTIVRASYGIFYDAPFDNLWENVIQNRYRTSTVAFNQPVSLPASEIALLASGTLVSSSDFANGLVFQPGLREPLIQSAFLGVQQKVTRGITAEVDALASRGRGLITTDIVNRQSDVLQPAFGNLDYRANQGSSDYTALTATLRFRRPWIGGQVSYTWGHSIDNQSDPLAGTYLSFNQLAAATQTAASISSFTRPFASSLDRGNSDFDQRQNLVFFVSSRLPGVLRGWTVAGIGALRSGLPFTVHALNQGAEILVNQRADLILPGQARLSKPLPGGRLLLNSAAFGNPAAGAIGNSGRNAFYGPGLTNTDASIARDFRVRAWRESTAITVRADAYNLFNHANLGNPQTFLGSPNFGVAQYGRTEAASGFPLLQPLSESARQIQIMLQVHF